MIVWTWPHQRYPATDSFGLHHNPKLHLTEPKLCTAFYCCSRELTASQDHHSMSTWASWRPFPCIANRINQVCSLLLTLFTVPVYLLPHLLPRVASHILISSIHNTKGESSTIKKAECQRIDAFEMWCWRRPLRVHWTARRSNQSMLKEINPKYSLEGLMLKLKLQYFGHLLRRTDSLEKTLMLGRLKAGGEGCDREWDGWMASLIHWTGVWASSGSWWWTGKPGVLQFMGSQKVRHN